MYKIHFWINKQERFKKKKSTLLAFTINPVIICFPVSIKNVRWVSSNKRTWKNNLEISPNGTIRVRLHQAGAAHVIWAKTDLESLPHTVQLGKVILVTETFK